METLINTKNTSSNTTKTITSYNGRGKREAIVVEFRVTKSGKKNCPPGGAGWLRKGVRISANFRCGYDDNQTFTPFVCCRILSHYSRARCNIAFETVHDATLSTHGHGDQPVPLSADIPSERKMVRKMKPRVAAAIDFNRAEIVQASARFCLRKGTGTRATL